MKRDPITGLAIGAATVTVALTAAAFWLSYEHLHDIADDSGLDGARAWAWPATVDLFIVAGELLILRAALRRTGMDWWAVALAATGSLGSIALNVAGVGAVAEPMEYIVAAVPPTAALLAFGAIMRQIHERLATTPAAPAMPVAPPAATPSSPAPPAATDEASHIAQAVDEAMRPVADDIDSVRLLTVADVAALKNVTQGTVRSWVNRGKLAPALRDANGRSHFHPNAVAALATPAVAPSRDGSPMEGGYA